MIYLTKEQYFELTTHTQQEYPKEACGILAGEIVNNLEFEVDHDKDISYYKKVKKIYKMANISETPELCYFMSPEEQLKVFKEIRQLGLEMIGIYHSHSKTKAYPSKKDCDLAFYPEVSYVIISLENFNNPIIRAFRIIEQKNIEEEKIFIK